MAWCGCLQVVFGSKLRAFGAKEGEEIGGARRDRTADLLRATQALSQLSYGPKAMRDLRYALLDCQGFNKITRQRV